MYNRGAENNTPLFRFDFCRQGRHRAKERKTKMKQEKSAIASYKLYNYSDEHEGFKIHSFMINEMGLRNNELLLYALIYTYFRDAEPFKLSRIAISKIIGCSVRTLDHTFETLLERDYIYKVGVSGKGVIEYAINIAHLPEIPMHANIIRLYCEEMEAQTRS